MDPRWEGRPGASVKAPLSILVPTLNEEVNLPACLKSCNFADQVIVVDSHSTDRSREIAKAHGATVVEHTFENYSAQKNWAIDTLPWRNDWIFILDADERFTPELAQEVSHIVSGAPSFVGFQVNRRFIFLGRWIKHCGWYPSWNLRLFRRGKARYDGRPVHEHMVADGPVGYLEHDLIHEDQKGLSAWLERHNRYSSGEAAARLSPERTPMSLQTIRQPMLIKKLIRERIWPMVPGKPVAFFSYMYFLRLGFLDGWPGLAFSLLQAQQELHVGLKIGENRRKERLALDLPSDVPG
ncbi:MAG: glycosyltransferase family 2 protein [Deltaproteobacteria bacterium]